MASLKKNILFFLSSFFLCGCMPASVITKTLYTEGSFRYRATETEMEEGYSVSSGLFTTNLSGEFTLTFNLVLTDNDKSIPISGDGYYSISATDDKNGKLVLDGKFKAPEGYEQFVDIEKVSIEYINYYFMYVSIDDVGKISFVR